MPGWQSCTDMKATLQGDFKCTCRGVSFHARRAILVGRTAKKFFDVLIHGTNKSVKSALREQRRERRM